MRLSPFVYLESAKAGRGTFRGVKLFWPLVSGSARLRLGGRLGVQVDTGEVEAGGFLSFSYNF